MVYASPLIALSLFLLVVVGLLLIRLIRLTPRTLPYKKRPFLMNPAEKKIFYQIQRVLPTGYVVFPQIVISAIAQSKGSGQFFWQYQNKINKKTIDFVVFTNNEYVPVLAIEYDGRMHERSDRKKRDAYVDTVMQTIGIPIVHIQHAQTIDVELLKKTIRRLLQHSPSKFVEIVRMI